MSKHGDFNFDDLQRELDVTQSYLNADNAESQTMLRRSLSNIRSSQEKVASGQSWMDQKVESQLPIQNNRPVLPITVNSTSSSTVPSSSSVASTLHHSEATRQSTVESEMSPKGEGSTGNRYANPKDRDALIQRLLTDYNTRKEKIATYMDEESGDVTRSSDHKIVDSLNNSRREQDASSRVPDSTSATIKFSNSQQAQQQDSRSANSTKRASPLPPVHPQSTPAPSNASGVVGSNKFQNQYSPDYDSMMSTPLSFYNGSSTQSSPLTDGTTNSNQGSGKKEDTIFYASDLRDGDNNVSIAYMGGADDLFDRHIANIQLSAPQYNGGLSPLPVNQRYDKLEKATALDVDPVGPLDTIKFTSSLPQSSKSIDSKEYTAKDNVNDPIDFAQTSKFTKDMQPWEQAMPDYQYQSQKHAISKDSYPSRSRSNRYDQEEQQSDAIQAQSTSIHRNQSFKIPPNDKNDFSMDEGVNLNSREGNSSERETSAMDDNHADHRLMTLDPNAKYSHADAMNHHVFDYSSLFKPSTHVRDNKSTVLSQGRSTTRSMSPASTTNQQSSLARYQSAAREPRGVVESSKREHRRSKSPHKPASKRSISAPKQRAASVERERIHLKSKEQLQQEMEAAFQKEHPFAPQLIASSNTVPGDNGLVQSKQRSRDIAQRIQEMQEEHKRKIEARERLRQECEKIDMLECTFQPELSKVTQKIIKAKEQQQQRHPSSRYSISRDDSQSSSADISKRLHDDAAHRVYYHHWLGQELEKIKLSEYTFTPTINSNTEAILEENGCDSRPIHERVVELQRQHRQRLQTIRNIVEREQVDLTFQPKIVDNSRVLAERRWLREQGVEPATTAEKMSGTEEALRVLSRHDEENNVAIRLLNEGRRIAKRKQLLLHEREQELADEMEQPVISRGSQKLAERSTFVKVDFETRQRLHESRVNRRYDERQRMDEEMFKTWFQPEVTKKTHKILADKRPEILHEDLESRSRRMAYEEMDKIENHRKELEKEIYQQVTFEPELDPISKLFGRKSSVQELYENPRGKQRAEQIRQRIEQDINDACTFTPKLNQKSRQLAEPDEYEQLYQRYQEEFQQRGYLENDMNAPNHSAFTANSSRQRISRINMKEPEKMLEGFKLKAIQKEEARRNDLMMRELKELEECTFHPNVYSYPPAYEPAKPIVVKGLARHLELRNLSNKMKEDAAQREYEVFHVVNADKYRRPEDGLTMVEPFEFNTSNYERHNQHQVKQR